jgi:hypothetical protein
MAASGLGAGAQRRACAPVGVYRVVHPVGQPTACSGAVVAGRIDRCLPDWRRQVTPVVGGTGVGDAEIGGVALVGRAVGAGLASGGGNRPSRRSQPQKSYPCSAPRRWRGCSPAAGSVRCWLAGTAVAGGGARRRRPAAVVRRARLRRRSGRCLRHRRRPARLQPLAHRSSLRGTTLCRSGGHRVHGRLAPASLSSMPSMPGVRRRIWLFVHDVSLQVDRLPSGRDR